MSDLIQKKTKGSLVTGLFLVFLFLATLNTIGRYYYFIYIAFFIFLMNQGRKFYIDTSVVSLLLLGFFWMVFSPDSTLSVFGVVKPYTYLLCYMMGYSFFGSAFLKDKSNETYSKFYKLVLVLSAGPFVHYILNWIKNGGTTERNTVDIWTGGVMAATGQSSLACLPLAIAVACVFSKIGIKAKIFSLATIIVILGYNLILSGRTIILLFLIACAAAFLYSLSDKRKGKFAMLLLILAVILSVIYIYNNDVFGIRSMIESSPLYDRFYGENAMELSEDGRLRKKMYHLKNFLEHPFGGAHTRTEIGYSHDLYLDTYDEAGIFAFFPIIIYVMISVNRFVKCVKNKKFPFEFRQIVFCVYVILNIEFWVEPILQGMPWLFATYCLIDGALAKILLNFEKQADQLLRE